MLRQTIPRLACKQFRAVNSRLSHFSTISAVATPTPVQEDATPSVFKMDPSDPNIIAEAAIDIRQACHLTKSLAVGYPQTPVAVTLLCKLKDPSVRDLRGSVVLPHGFMESKVCVISNDPAKRKEASENGASIVGDQALLEKLRLDEMDVDRLIVTPEILPLLSPLARILGPKGIMPTVKKGTVTGDIKTALKNQADAVLYKVDVNGTISTIIGKAGMKLDHLVENATFFVNQLKASKKGKQTSFVNVMWLQSQAGPQLFLNKSEFKV